MSAASFAVHEKVSLQPRAPRRSTRTAPACWRDCVAAAQVTVGTGAGHLQN